MIKFSSPGKFCTYLALNFNTFLNSRNAFWLIGRKVFVMRKMTPSVDLVYLNRGAVLKKFVMSENESGPVVVELPGSVMAWRGVERGSRMFALVPVRDSLKRAARTRMEPSDRIHRRNLV